MSFLFELAECRLDQAKTPPVATLCSVMLIGSELWTIPSFMPYFFEARVAKAGVR